ncbi:hypothetical protein [Sphingomonas sp. BK235]|uniref:hypothetical protein n=1 Tax=Sphingomonas sp. BK235 TaxID=2512131 RepID=UPI00104BEA86|nr:hypothetical protein [Sphingomonas sp. BK235]
MSVWRSSARTTSVSATASRATRVAARQPSAKALPLAERRKAKAEVAESPTRAAARSTPWPSAIASRKARWRSADQPSARREAVNGAVNGSSSGSVAGAGGVSARRAGAVMPSIGDMTVMGAARCG